MKVLDVEPLVILDVYLKEIRSILELALPAGTVDLLRNKKQTLREFKGWQLMSSSVTV